jgi:hypothetical protein
LVLIVSISWGVQSVGSFLFQKSAARAKGDAAANQLAAPIVLSKIRLLSGVEGKLGITLY